MRAPVVASDSRRNHTARDVGDWVARLVLPTRSFRELVFSSDLRLRKPPHLSVTEPIFHLYDHQMVECMRFYFIREGPNEACGTYRGRCERVAV